MTDIHTLERLRLTRMATAQLGETRDGRRVDPFALSAVTLQ